MTKGQNAAADRIEAFLSSDQDIISWEDIREAVKASKARVSNWWTIRYVLQWFIAEGLIKRTCNLRKEEYEKA